MTLLAIANLSENEHSWYENNAFPKYNSCSHEVLAVRTFISSRLIQCKPRRVDPGTTGEEGKLISVIQRAHLFLYASPSSQNLHDATKPTMVCCERRVIQTPPLKIIPVPLFNGQVDGEFHPMSLSFIVAKHGGDLKAFETFASGIT